MNKKSYLFLSTSPFLGWFERANRRPVCKNDEGRDKHFVMKGVEDFAVLISKLNEQD